jgi:molybdate transport system substrate-binding protein
MKNGPVKLVLLLLVVTVTLGGWLGCRQTPTAPVATTPVTAPAPSSPESSMYAKELTVFAAAGTKPAIDKAAELFQQKYGTKVTVNYGGGGEVLSSMIIAKQGDVYIAPEQRFMARAKEQGAIGADVVPTTVAYMIPVIGVPKGNPQNIRSLADLARPGIKVVMGNPETTALGLLVPEMLKKAGLYTEVQPNIVTNVPQVTAMVTMLKMGQVDAGVIWHYFGVTSASDVDIIWIPPECMTGIGEIQAAVSTYSQEAVTAQKFLDMLVAPEGKEIFRKYGYIVDRDEANKYWRAQ